MLTANVDVSDGLVNGARGEVVHFIRKPNGGVITILVKFDNSSVGQVAIQSSKYRTSYSNAVPLTKHEAMFLAMGKLGYEVRQFLLTLAWSTTMHKVQGLTLDEIVVDMDRFSPGQAHVAFSKVKTLQGLQILNFNSKAIKSSKKVSEEMDRLGTKVIACIPMLKCHGLSDTHVTIVLLNVRCILAKLPDLTCDINMACATVMFL